MTLGRYAAKATAECQRRKEVYSGHRKTLRSADLQTALLRLHIGSGFAFATLEPAPRLLRYVVSRLCPQASEAAGSSFSSSAISSCRLQSGYACFDILDFDGLGCVIED